MEVPRPDEYDEQDAAPHTYPSYDYEHTIDHEGITASDEPPIDGNPPGGTGFGEDWDPENKARLLSSLFDIECASMTDISGEKRQKLLSAASQEAIAWLDNADNTLQLFQVSRPTVEVGIDTVAPPAEVLKNHLNNLGHHVRVIDDSTIMCQRLATLAASHRATEVLDASHVAISNRDNAAAFPIGNFVVQVSEQGPTIHEMPPLEQDEILLRFDTAEGTTLIGNDGKKRYQITTTRGVTIVNKQAILQLSPNDEHFLNLLGSQLIVHKLHLLQAAAEAGGDTSRLLTARDDIGTVAGQADIIAGDSGFQDSLLPYLRTALLESISEIQDTLRQQRRVNTITNNLEASGMQAVGQRVAHFFKVLSQHTQQ